MRNDQKTMLTSRREGLDSNRLGSREEVERRMKRKVMRRSKRSCSLRRHYHGRVASNRRAERAISTSQSSTGAKLHCVRCCRRARVSCPCIYLFAALSQDDSSPHPILLTFYRFQARSILFKVVRIGTSTGQHRARRAQQA
jgi:hypothetical protein